MCSGESLKPDSRLLSSHHSRRWTEFCPAVKLQNGYTNPKMSAEPVSTKLSVSVQAESVLIGRDINL